MFFLSISKSVSSGTDLNPVLFGFGLLIEIIVPFLLLVDCILLLVKIWYLQKWKKMSCDSIVSAYKNAEFK